VPGRRSRVVVALLTVATVWAVAACGRSGPALVDSSTTRPVPTVSSATSSTRPSTTAVPTTRGIPTTTGRVPLTTAPTGPAGAPLTFRRLTIRLARAWRAGGGGDHVEVTTSRACRRSAGRVDCPGFLLLGPSQIAIASELAPFDPDKVWHPGTGVEGCPEDRDGLAEVTPTDPVRRGKAKVGGKDAVYREWRVDCVDARTGKPKTSYTQRVWYLERSGILVVDEWSTPGLGAVLAAGRFG
jgi:predicted small lipoprotein YifL